MQVRRKIINQCKGQPRLQKVLAFAICLKRRLGRSSMMKNYTINKIHTLTGISPTTIHKYMPLLVQQGWVHFAGKNNQHLIVSNMASHTDKRNICIDRFCFDTFKDVYRSLRSFIALIIQAHKDFIRRTIQIANDPKRGQDFKAARRLVKRLVKENILNSIYAKYKEYGLSLKRIAKETGFCVRTAQNIMNYAIEQGWVTKQHHSDQVAATNTFHRQVEGYTFTTQDNLYRVYANTYTLDDNIRTALGGGSWCGITLDGRK